MRRLVLAAALATAVASVLCPGGARASFEGENGAIVFVRGGDLFSVGPGDGKSKRLTKTKELEGNPSISPDGRFVVYERGKRPNGDVVPAVGTGIWSMRIDGSKQRALTGRGHARKDNAFFGSASPSFSPDGKTIAYGVTEFYVQRFQNIPDVYVVRHNKIYTMRADGSHKRLLSENADDTRPLFEPGGRIVFFGNKRRNDVYSMTAAGKDRELFPELSFSDSDLGFAPDGEKVVFASSSRDDSKCTEIYSVGSDGTALARLTDNMICDDQPVISPDGQRLAYAQWDGGGRCKDGTIFLAVPDGSGAQPLTRGCAPDWASR